MYQKNKFTPGGASDIVAAIIQILQVDRRPESIQKGLDTLSIAPIQTVTQSIIQHMIGPAIFVLSGMQNPEFPISPNQLNLYKILKAQYQFSRKRFEIANTSSKKVTEILNNIGIYPLFLKGITLAESLYPDPIMRPFSDLDIIVSIDEYQSAQKALLVFQEIRSGSWSSSFIANPSDKQYLRLSIDIQHFDKTGYIKKPIGQFLGINYHEEIGRIYDSSNIIDSKFGRIRVANEGFLLRYLCVHYMKHLLEGYGTILGLCDIAFLIEKYGQQLDWDKSLDFQILSGSEKINCNPFYPPLLFASKWLKADVPEEMIEKLRTNSSRSIKHRVLIEKMTFGSSIFKDYTSHVFKGYRLWLSKGQVLSILPMTICSIFPTIRALRENGFLSQGEGILSGYIKWYKLKFELYIKPVVKHLLMILSESGSPLLMKVKKLMG